MGSEIPKQFLLLNNKPILMHTIELFYKFDSQFNILVVLPKSQIDYWKNLVQEYHFNIKHQIVEGGKERFFSVKNALSIIKEGEVWIHDGVRPLVSKQTLSNITEAIKKHSAVIPVLPVEESLRKLEAGKTKAVNRKEYYLVQTPQVFKTKEIQKYYTQEYSEIFTDDASVYENGGGKISEVLGNKENIKITSPEDLSLAKYYLKTNMQ